MIEYSKKSIFDSNCQAITNPVNCIGISGAGLALQFKLRYPDNYIIYKEACDNNIVKIGKMFVVKLNHLFIINFPTKQHWKHVSLISYIDEGLKDLKEVIINNNINSIAIPKLGCGLGGLSWEAVQQLIEKYLSDIEANILICI